MYADGCLVCLVLVHVLYVNIPEETTTLGNSSDRKLRAAVDKMSSFLALPLKTMYRWSFKSEVHTFFHIHISPNKALLFSSVTPPITDGKTGHQARISHQHLQKPPGCNGILVFSPHYSHPVPFHSCESSMPDMGPVPGVILHVIRSLTMQSSRSLSVSQMHIS